MFDYLQKFDELPQTLQDNVSSPAAMAVIADLEGKYKLDLAALVMKVMVKDIPLADLPTYLVSENHLTQEDARRLVAELKERLFFSVANYLGYNPSYAAIVPQTTPASSYQVTVKKIIRESGVNFAGSELNSRLETILTTYLKGVRSRIDTRFALNKDVAGGGLGLDHAVIDRLFVLVDQNKNLTTTPPPIPTPPTTPTPTEDGLAKVRATYEAPGATRDIPYDLEAALAAGQVSTVKTEKEKEEQKLLNEGDKPKTLEAPELLPLDVPKAPIEEKVVTPPVVSKPTPPLIERPPEKKPGLLTKFTGATPPVVMPPIPPLIPVPPVARPVPKPASVASLRQQAGRPIVAPHIKKAPEPVMASPSPVTRPIPPPPPVTPPTPPAPVAPPTPQSPRVAPRTLGPIEELHYLDLVNFRRLGSSPKDAAMKVESKIRTLEIDGYDKMVEGILSWRSGEINAIYLKMAKEALTHSVTLKQIADKYQVKRDSNYLTWEEIEELIALNSRLAF